MGCDWLFVNQDRSRLTVTLQEPTLPQLGEGKPYGGRGYEVVLVVTNRIAEIRWLLDLSSCSSLKFRDRQPTIKRSRRPPDGIIATHWVRAAGSRAAAGSR